MIICGKIELGKMCFKVVSIASLETESNALAMSKKITAADGWNSFMYSIVESVESEHRDIARP